MDTQKPQLLPVALEYSCTVGHHLEVSVFAGSVESNSAEVNGGGSVKSAQASVIVRVTPSAPVYVHGTGAHGNALLMPPPLAKKSMELCARAPVTASSSRHGAASRDGAARMMMAKMEIREYQCGSGGVVW